MHTEYEKMDSVCFSLSIGFVDKTKHNTRLILYKVMNLLQSLYLQNYINPSILIRHYCMQFLYHKYVLGTTSLIIHISPILKFSCGNFNKHLNSYGNINDDSALSSSAYRREQLSGCWHWVAANILLVAPFFFVCVFLGFFFPIKTSAEKKSFSIRFASEVHTLVSVRSQFTVM